MAYRTSVNEPSHVRWSARIAAAAALLLLLSVASFAQGGLASINGTVTDQSGALVTNATVNVTNAATGQSRQTNTADNGTYVLPLLPGGVYTVTCSHAGFRSVSHPNHPTWRLSSL